MSERPDPAEIEPPASAMELTVYDITLNGVSLGIGSDDQGRRFMTLGPVAFRFLVPLSAEIAREMATTLAGGVELGQIDLKGTGLSPEQIAAAAQEAMLRGHTPRRGRR